MKKKNFVILLSVLGLLFIALGFILFIFNKDNTENYKKIENKEIKYIVKKNETLDDISIKFNLTQEFILDYNKINLNDFKENIELNIPNVTLYRLDKNESLEDISKKFKITLNTLYKINKSNYSNEKSIFIPNTKIHLVKENESLSSISNKYNITERQLLLYNNIKNSKIVKDDILYIPYQVGLKKMNDNIFITIDNFNSFEKLHKIGVDMYKNNEYLKYKNENNIYYITYGEAIKYNREISKYVCDANYDDILFKYNLNFAKENDCPIEIYNKCSFSLK